MEYYVIRLYIKDRKDYGYLYCNHIYETVWHANHFYKKEDAEKRFEEIKKPWGLSYPEDWENIDFEKSGVRKITLTEEDC